MVWLWCGVIEYYVCILFPIIYVSYNFVRILVFICILNYVTFIWITYLIYFTFLGYYPYSTCILILNYIYIFIFICIILLCLLWSSHHIILSPNNIYSNSSKLCSIAYSLYPYYNCFRVIILIILHIHLSSRYELIYYT